MKFRLHITLQDDSEDIVVIEGDTIEELREAARTQVRIRNGKDAWSEEIA